MDFNARLKRLKSYFQLRPELNMHVSEAGSPYYSDNWIIIRFALENGWYITSTDSPNRMPKLDKQKAFVFAVPEAVESELNRIWEALLDEESPESKQAEAYINERLTHLQYVEHALVTGKRLKRKYLKQHRTNLQRIAL